MANGVSVRIRGLDKLKAELGPNLIAGPVRRFLERAAIVVQSESRKRTPVDRGRLRNSVAYELDGAHLPRWAKVGSNLDYAEPVHEGSKPHFPPVSALMVWAARHPPKQPSPPKRPISTASWAFLIARSISRKGTTGRPFLTDGLSASEGRIRALVPRLAADIEREAGSS